MNIEIKQALLRVLPFAVILLILVLAIKRGKINRAEIGWITPAPWSKFVQWCALFFVFVIAVEVVLYYLKILEPESWNHSFLPSIIRILGAIVLAPVTEEIIFRGLLLSKLQTKLNNLHAAIILQAIIFVLLHNFAYQNTLTSNIGIVQSCIDASLYGYARYYTKSLYTPIFMHMSGNFVAVFERIIC